MADKKSGLAKTKWIITFKTSAFREYKKLDKKNRLKINEILEMLQINPLGEALKIKKIQNKRNCYRIRTGDYRVIYSIQKNQLIVEIIRLGHRKDVYRYF